MAYVPVELADPASIDEALAALDGEWDGVAHIAGIPGTAPDDKVIAVNFLGMRRFVTGIAGRIKRGGGLAIVASTAGSAWSLRLAQNEGLPRRRGLPKARRGTPRTPGRATRRTSCRKRPRSPSPSSSPPTPGASTASGSTP